MIDKKLYVIWFQGLRYLGLSRLFYLLQMRVVIKDTLRYSNKNMEGKLYQFHPKYQRPRPPFHVVFLISAFLSNLRTTGIICANEPGGLVCRTEFPIRQPLAEKNAREEDPTSRLLRCRGKIAWSLLHFNSFQDPGCSSSPFHPTDHPLRQPSTPRSSTTVMQLGTNKSNCGPGGIKYNTALMN